MGPLLSPIVSNIYSLAEFFGHINNIWLTLKFTMEVECEHKLPFLDILVIKDHNELVTKVTKKNLHAGRYPHHHPIQVKSSIMKTHNHVPESQEICSHKFSPLSPLWIMATH